ncbi:transglutaminase domain-containing protein [Kurthia sibirica]|uniref:S-layer protein n=1 Tax=Kurthia sibirica TaxID=202750 RepID=A0A2U3AEF3_9BACL|nr:transglutaminase domain-containing protein [Kurthia sibirica]PWI22821.1 S-layer protein [Kurthia sibirica]GEK35677.1 hypothetical protein KSI01_32100 [Kurthia sibirica]
MAINFESLQQFQASGGLKSTTITAQQLLPAIVTHIQRMDRKFTLQVNGRLPKAMNELLADTFELSHLQQPFYTQHCSSRGTSHINVSKNRVKINFTVRYRMTKDEQSWVIDEIQTILQRLALEEMTPLEQVTAVHDYIVRNHQYEMQTDGSPFTVYTFMHEKKGVCMAYALLFEKMMELLAIPCYYVVGHANGEGDLGHAWNMVKLDGEWYHIDATWNDLGSKTKTHEIRYRYFLRTDDFMAGDHQWNLEHYPPCVSKRFDGLSNLYDVSLCKSTLYFPHPKTAKLTSALFPQLVFKELLPIRVQFCTLKDHQLYFSNYSDEGFLYSYNLVTKEVSCHCKKVVTAISSDLQQIMIHFEDGTIQRIDKITTVEKQDSVVITEPDTVIPFMNFGDSWFGSYEGAQQRIAMHSEDGVRLIMSQAVKKLTVDLLLHKGFQVTLTAGKKTLQLNEAASLILPKTLLPSTTELTLSSGMPIDYDDKDEVFIIRLLRSDTVLFKL